VAREPGITQQAVGDAAGVDPSTMVATLDSLEERGLAERRPHETDRRKRAVYLTKRGEEAAREARRLGEEVGREVFGALTATERKQLNALLRKLAGLADTRVPAQRGAQAERGAQADR
jgi:MarR family transcriptional regulator for hemolysin